MSGMRRCGRVVGLSMLALVLGSITFVSWPDKHYAAAASEAVQQDGVQQGVAEFHDQLKSGLRARRPLEFDFIAVVVNHVEQGRLSKKMVMSTFQWSRERDEFRPFPHFQFALRRQAAEVGVSL